MVFIDLCDEGADLAFPTVWHEVPLYDNWKKAQEWDKVDKCISNLILSQHTKDKTIVYDSNFKIIKISSVTYEC